MGSIMAEESVPPDIAKLTFEAALSDLEKIVRDLEEGGGKLDDSIKAYERGALLKRHCEAKLQEARARVEKIVLAADGSLSAQPVEKD
jgi:exodeoxyribonuclease VII small subunit